ncbi:hypothetical protein HDV05_008271, partial [Chytridiales sp. JEL 0842]
LDKDFQDFLRKAAMFGQYFHVADINKTFGTKYDHDGRLKSWITKVDQYRFLAIHEGEDINEDDIYFKHITVQTAIYESLSYELRSQWHLQISRQYEEQLTNDNEEALITSIAHHYSRTTDVEKIVYYLEKLGYSTLRKCYYRESQSALERLLDFVEHCQIPTATEIGHRAAITDPVRQADWIGHLCYNLVQLKHLDNVVSLCLKALSMVGVNYPVGDDKLMKKEMFKSMIRLYFKWRKTKGGRKLLKINGKEVQYFVLGETGHNIGEGCSANCVNCPKVRRVITTALRALYQGGSVQSSLSRPAFAVILFELCNADIGTACVDNGEFITSLFRSAFIFALVIPPLGDALLRAGEKLEIERKLGDKTHFVYYAISYNKFAKGDIDGACDLARKSLVYFLNRDDLTNSQGARVILAAYPIWRGDLNHTLITINGQWDKSWFKIQPIWTFVALFSVSRVYFLQGDAQNLRQMIEIQTFYFDSLPKTGAFKGYDSMLLLSTAWYHMFEHDHIAALETFEKIVRAFASVQMVGFAPPDVLFFSCILLWELCAFWTGNRFSEDDISANLARLKSPCEHMLKKCNEYKTAMPVKWIKLLYETVLQSITGDTQKGIDMLIKECQRKKTLTAFETFPLMKATVYGIIGKFHYRGEVAHEYSTTAIDMFSEFGATFMVQWCQRG